MLPTTFHFQGYQYNEQTRTAHLHYAFGTGEAFEETFVFHNAPEQLTPEQRAALNACLRALHLAAGVSYYKAVAGAEIVSDFAPLSPAEAAFFTTFYTLGLGEFSYRNTLPLNGKIHFPADTSATAQPVHFPSGGKVLVPVGGGKDSSVSIELMRRSGEDVLLFSVGKAAPIMETIQAARLPSAHVTRSLSPALFELNAKGAPNGHIPVTGVLSFAMLAAAVLYGCKAVVMSNERSANVGNFVWDNMEVNHQYSKSYGFETLFRSFVTENVLQGVDYFSLLRPLSELAIARLFAGFTAYHGVFVSCNTAFKIHKEAGAALKWCGDCPKCRFVFLVLAPFMPKEKLVAIFGKNLLDDPAQTHGFSELLALEGHKPFECVGEVEECRAAFLAVAEQPAWQEDTLVAALQPSVRALVQGSAAKAVAALMVPSADHHVPNAYMEVLHDALDR